MTFETLVIFAVRAFYAFIVAIFVLPFVAIIAHIVREFRRLGAANDRLLASAIGVDLPPGAPAEIAFVAVASSTHAVWLDLAVDGSPPRFVLDLVVDANGERLYPADQVERLRMIRRLLDHGRRPARIVGASVEELSAMLDACLCPEGGTPAGRDDGLLQLVRLHRSVELAAALRQALLKQGLQRFVADLVPSPLDPGRPLWAMLVVDTALGGQALVLRIHPSIADRIALVGVVLALTDGVSGTEDRYPPPVASEDDDDDDHEHDVFWQAIWRPLADAVRGSARFALDLRDEWQDSPINRGPRSLYPYDPIRYFGGNIVRQAVLQNCLLYTSPSPRDRTRSRMPSSA